MDAVELLIGLVQHASISGAEDNAVRWLVGQMQAAGLDAHIDEVGNAVGRTGNGAIEVMLLGHIDTVPGDIPVRREGDLLYGRGAIDAKGPLAAFVAAAAQGALPGLKLTVIGALAEETDSKGANYILDHYPRPDYLIIGEPSHWDRITLGYKGSVWYALDVELPNAHAASGQVTVCEIAVNVWANLRAWCESYNAGRTGVFNQLTPVLRELWSENDGLSQEAGLQVNFRLPPGLSVAELQAGVFEHAGPNVEVIELSNAVPAHRAAKNTPLVRAALAAIRAEGGKPRFVVKTGTSDMNVVAPVWQCPTIAYGPGDSALDHTPHEHISIGEYQRSIAVLRRMLARLAG